MLEIKWFHHACQIKIWEKMLVSTYQKWFLQNWTFQSIKLFQGHLISMWVFLNYQWSLWWRGLEMFLLSCTTCGLKTSSWRIWTLVWKLKNFVLNILLFLVIWLFIPMFFDMVLAAELRIVVWSLIKGLFTSLHLIAFFYLLDHQH